MSAAKQPATGPAVPPVDGDALRAVALGFIADVIEYQFNRADDDTHGEVLERIEDRAREIATAHGYDGTRWPAMAEGQPSANPPQSQGRDRPAAEEQLLGEGVKAALEAALSDERRLRDDCRRIMDSRDARLHAYCADVLDHVLRSAPAWCPAPLPEKQLSPPAEQGLLRAMVAADNEDEHRRERRRAREEHLPPAAPPAAEGAMRDALAFAGNLVCGEYCGGDHYIASHGHSTECRRISAALLGHRPQPPADPHPPADAARETP